MKDIPTDALSFNMFYGGFSPTDDKPADQKSKEAKIVEVNEGTPIFRNIYMKNIYCDGAKDAIVIQGLPERTIKGIELENIVMSAERGISIFDADGVKLSDAKIQSTSPVVKISQSQNVSIYNLMPGGNNDIILKLEGPKIKNITISGKNTSEIKLKTKYDENVSKNALTVK